MLTWRVYIPVFQAEEWAQTTPIYPDTFDYYAMDNQSSDNTVDILRRRGVQVTQHPTNIGRIGNWDACLQDFLGSNAEWMIWLFSGDKHFPAITRWPSLADAHPEVGQIIGAYQYQRQESSYVVRAFEQQAIFSPQESMENVAAKGNWFGAPSAIAIRRSTLINGWQWNDLQWTADMWLSTQVAQRTHTLYDPQTVTRFYAPQRNYYQQHKNSARAVIEEAYVRQLAINYLQENADNPEIIATAEANVDRWLTWIHLRQRVYRMVTPFETTLFSLTDRFRK